MTAPATAVEASTRPSGQPTTGARTAAYEVVKASTMPAVRRRLVKATAATKTASAIGPLTNGVPCGGTPCLGAAAMRTLASRSATAKPWTDRRSGVPRTATTMTQTLERARRSSAVTMTHRSTHPDVVYAFRETPTTWATSASAVILTMATWSHAGRR